MAKRKRDKSDHIGTINQISRPVQGRSWLHQQPRRVLDPRDLPGLSIGPDIARALAGERVEFRPTQFQGPKPGVVLNPEATPRAQLIGALQAPAPLRRAEPQRVLRPSQAGGPKASVKSADEPARSSHDPNHSLKVREPKSCKERPDNSKRTRGDGVSRRDFVPWCSRRS
ncbi:hypothetical protein [Tortoise microvirus 82]|nr:hypothetical protein [Tortoise microvirus 82]